MDTVQCCTLRVTVNLRPAQDQPLPSAPSSSQPAPLAPAMAGARYAHATWSSSQPDPGPSGKWQKTGRIGTIIAHYLPQFSSFSCLFLPYIHILVPFLIFLEIRKIRKFPLFDLVALTGGRDIFLTNLLDCSTDAFIFILPMLRW